MTTVPPVDAKTTIALYPCSNQVKAWQVQVCPASATLASSG